MSPPIAFPESRLGSRATAVAFALVSALLAALVMTALETRLLDELAYELGVALATVVGFAAATIAKRRGAFTVAVAGALVGMTIQAILLVRLPAERTYFMTSAVTTRDPVSWVGMGAILGILPAIGAAVLFLVAIHMARTAGRPAPRDAEERVVLPLAGAAAVLAGLAMPFTRGAEVIVDGIVLVVACAALVEIVRIDRARMRWLRDVFEEREPTYRVLDTDDVPAMDLPLVIGGIAPSVVVAHAPRLGTYRSAACARYAAAALTLEATTVPLRRRSWIAGVLASAGLLEAVLATAMR